MITVVPDTYTKVDYDVEALRTGVQRSWQRVMGTARELDLEIRLDEDAATTRFSVLSLDPLIVEVDGGAIENLRDPRTLGENEVELAFTRLFLEVYDRQLAVFGAPPLDEELSQAHRTAWDVNLFGRVARRGVRLHKPRYLYNFRNRHGFTDHADAIFEQLWDAGDTTWRRIADFSDSALRPPN
jgi:hypothetical protein